MQAHPQSNSAARAQSSSLIHPDDLTRHVVGSPPCPAGTGTLSGTSGLAHDAGNLLAGLRLYADLLARPGVLAPENKHYASELQLLADRSTRLVQRLLEQFATPPLSGAVAVRPRRSFPVESRSLQRSSGHDLAATLNGLASLLGGLAAPSTVTVRTSGDPVPFVSLAPEAVERIVVNLVCNAAQAIAQTGDGPGEVQVKLDQSPTRLLLEVQDNGPGLSAGQIAAFLNPQPTHSWSRRGLGHRIVRELATETGAEITVRSTTSGSTFLLEWPVAGAICPAVRTASSAIGRPNQEATHTC